MERQRIQEREAQCIQEQPPACSAGCPIHVDARGLAEAVGKGDFPAAFALFARKVPFPSILARVCDRPCEKACRRVEAGDAVAIRALERAAVDFGAATARRPMPPRTRGKRVAVVGAGLSGLTAAYDLALKGREVVVYEYGGKPLKCLRGLPPGVLPDEVIDKDLAILGELGVVINFNAPVDDARLTELAQSFDALYLGMGPLALVLPSLAMTGTGRVAVDPDTYATSNPKIFAGGGQRYGAAFSPITSIHDGRFAAQSIERFLQGASLTANRDDHGAHPTRLYTDTSRFAPLPVVGMGDPANGYSRDEAMREASRCFPCQCLECVRVCEYLSHYGAYPKRYVREIFNNDSIVMGAHKANRMLNSCSLCGLCEAVCPEGLGMAETCLEARQSLVAKGKMPPSAHDFALRDMAFSTSDAFSLARHQPERQTSAAVFFPGCQLSASSPGHVERTYEYLRAVIPGGVGLMLGCCGAPARWAGRETLYEDTHAAFVEQWRHLGAPPIIAACSTCFDMFRNRLPEEKVISLWSVFERHGLPGHPAGRSPSRLALHDPCTTRTAPEIRQSVRALLSRLNVAVEELNVEGMGPCCGFGGLMSSANPEIADKVADRRIGESDADYLAYCAMCRDNFARRGKRSVHLLDLIFPTAADPAARPDPGISKRHEERARLKTRLLRRLWKEETMPEADQVPLILTPEVQAKVERRQILLDDIRQVIAATGQSGGSVRDPASGHLFATLRLATVTYWVEFTASPTGFMIHSAYSHRMEIGTEASP